MGYGLDGWGFIPGRGRIFFSSPQCPELLKEPPSFLFNRYGFFSLRGKTEKRQGCYTYYSLPGWSYTPIPLILHGVVLN
jgi:hypothetical protein